MNPVTPALGAAKAPGPGFGRQLVSTSLGLWSATALAFASTAVVARSLGAPRYGELVLAVALVTLVTTFLDLTLEEGVVHHGFRLLASGDEPALRQLLRVALVIDVTIGVLTSAAIVALAGPIASLASHGRVDADLLRLAALVVLAGTVDGTTGAVLLLAGRPHLRGWLMALTNLARFAFALVAVNVGGSAAVLVAFALAAGVGSAAQAVVSWRVAWRQWPRPEGGGDTRRWVSTLARFGVHSSVTTSALAVKGALVEVVLGRRAGTAAVGTFNVAMLPVTAVNVLSAPVRTVLLPEQSRLAAAGDVEGLRRTVRAYTALGLGLGVVGVVVGWVALPWLLPTLYSREFENAVGPARLLLPMAVVYLALGWSKTFPAAIGRPQLRTRLTLLDLAVTVAVVIPLASRGASGAATALSVSSLLVGLAWWVSARRLLDTEASTAVESSSAPAGQAGP